MSWDTLVVIPHARSDWLPEPGIEIPGWKAFRQPSYRTGHLYGNRHELTERPTISLTNWRLIMATNYWSRRADALEMPGD